MIKGCHLWHAGVKGWRCIQAGCGSALGPRRHHRQELHILDWLSATESDTSRSGVTHFSFLSFLHFSVSLARYKNQDWVVSVPYKFVLSNVPCEGALSLKATVISQLLINESGSFIIPFKKIAPNNKYALFSSWKAWASYKRKRNVAYLITPADGKPMTPYTSWPNYTRCSLNSPCTNSCTLDFFPNWWCTTTLYVRAGDKLWALWCEHTFHQCSLSCLFTLIIPSSVFKFTQFDLGVESTRLNAWRKTSQKNIIS